MEQEDKEPENCHSNYRLIHRKYSSRSQCTGRWNHQSWPTMKWFTPFNAGECVPLLRRCYAVQKPSTCSPLALDWVLGIFVFDFPALPSTTLPGTEQGLINNCWVKQTFKKECPHSMGGWTRRFLSTLRFSDYRESLACDRCSLNIESDDACLGLSLFVPMF